MYILFLLFSLLHPGEQNHQSIWTAEELAIANTAAQVDYLNDEEKKIVMLVNLARLDGTRYLQSYFMEYNATAYTAMRSSVNSYLKSLRKDLDQVRNLPMLQPDEGLCKAASFHARDTGKKGLVGHTSSDGTGFSKRLPKYVKGWNRLAENCSYGYNEAAMIVGQLLLDENVPSLGHRKSIVNPELQYIGVSIQPHSQYGYNCVMDFCAKFEN